MYEEESSGRERLRGGKRALGEAERKGEAGRGRTRDEVERDDEL